MNPGSLFQSIECVLWGEHKFTKAKHYVIYEDIVFQNSGVHGYQEVMADHIIIRNCEFRFIGGAVWSKELKIRFGNAVEFWNGAKDIFVENCTFYNIYDSGVTHQGDDDDVIPERIYFRNNRFIDYGMAAYECRGPAAKDVYFENNTCINAGGGFSMQGGGSATAGRIYPEPMGHHVFTWRIDEQLQKGYIYIRNNDFFEAPLGAALYFIIDPEIKEKFVIDNNRYHQTTGTILACIDDKQYMTGDFDLFQKETGYDKHSKII